MSDQTRDADNRGLSVEEINRAGERIAALCRGMDPFEVLEAVDVAMRTLWPGDGLSRISHLEQLRLLRHIDSTLTEIAGQIIEKREAVDRFVAAAVDAELRVRNG